MIPFDKIEQFLHEARYNHMRVYDRTLTNHLIDLHGTDSTDLFNKFSSHINVLSDYEILSCKVGNDDTVKCNWTKCSIWKINLGSNKQNTIIDKTPINTGISKDYLDLSIQLERLKLQVEFNEKSKEFEKQKNSSEEDKYIKYLPFIAPLLGIKDEDLFKRFQMMGMINGTLSGSTHTQQNNIKNKLTIEGTADEKEKIVEKLVPSIYNKVDKDKFIVVLDAMDKNPDLLNIAYEYLPMMNTNGAIAGDNTNNFYVFDINATYSIND